MIVGRRTRNSGAELWSMTQVLNADPVRGDVAIRRVAEEIAVMSTRRATLFTRARGCNTVDRCVSVASIRLNVSFVIASGRGEVGMWAY